NTACVQGQCMHAACPRTAWVHAHSACVSLHSTCPPVHSLSEVLFCQPDMPSLGLAVTFDNEQLFWFDAPLSRWQPRLPDFPAWPEATEPPSELVHDTTLCQDMCPLSPPATPVPVPPGATLAGATPTGATPCAAGIPVANVFLKRPLEFGRPNTLVCMVGNIFPPAVTIGWQRDGVPVTDGVTDTTYTPIEDLVPQDPVPSDVLATALCGVARGNCTGNARGCCMGTLLGEIARGHCTGTRSGRLHRGVARGHCTATLLGEIARGHCTGTSGGYTGVLDGDVLWDIVEDIEQGTWNTGLTGRLHEQIARAHCAGHGTGHCMGKLSGSHMGTLHGDIALGVVRDMARGHCTGNRMGYCTGKSHGGL
uniref:Ig-like domain-containing protein n=1 Tax=Anas zonorhyncha TaxID=75864 RepID=A0A8B9UGF4_9AVES